MKLIITGSSGFLGSNLYNSIKDNKDLQIFCLSRTDNGSIKCDLNDFNSLKQIINEINPDIVYHFAANPIVKNNDSSIIENNVVITDKLLKSCRACNFVFASSATVYGQSIDTKKPFTVDDELRPESLYAVTKVQSEELIKFYFRTGHINKYLIYRYVAHVGKYATHGVLIDIINKIKRSKGSIDIIGKYPGTIKPFTLASQSMLLTHIYTNDFFKEYKNSIVNMSPQDSISVDDLVNIVFNVMQVKLEKKWLGESFMWQGDQKKLMVDSIFKDKLYESKKAIEIATKQILGIL